MRLQILSPLFTSGSCRKNFVWFQEAIRSGLHTGCNALNFQRELAGLGFRTSPGLTLDEQIDALPSTRS